MAGRVGLGVKAFFITLFIVGWIGAMFAMVIAQETPKGVVTGVVVHRDKEVYKGLVSGAKVILSGGDRLFRSTTDGRGRYRFVDVPTGHYWMHATARDLVSYDGQEAEVKEGRTTNVKPIVMQTRPPEMSASFSRSVFIPGDKVRLNIRGYTRKDTQAHVAYYTLDARALVISRNARMSGGGSPIWDFANHTPIQEWDVQLKQDPEGFFDRQVTIQVESQGSYLVRVTMGEIVSDSAFSLSDIALVAKQSKGKLLTYCVDFRTRKPIEGAAIDVYDAGSRVQSGSTGSDGIFDGTGGRSRALVIAQKGDSFASTDSSYYGSEEGSYNWLIYTDRPVYRPGHVVYFKGIIRRVERNFYRTPPSTPIEVDIKQPSGEVVKHLSLQTNGYGTFHGQVQLGSEIPLGEYQIEASYGNENGAGSFQVAEYRKPDFRVSVSFDKPYFVAGTPIRATVNASYYFGAPVANAEVSYTVYRSAWSDESDYDMGFYSGIEKGNSEEDAGYGEVASEGKGRTDADGRLKLAIPTDRSLEGDADYKVEVNVTDPGLRTIQASGSVFVPKGLFRIEIKTDQYIFRPDQEVALKLRAVDHEKRPRGGVKLDVSVDEEKWEYETRRYRSVTSGSVTTGDDGRAVFRFKPAKEGYFRVRVQTRDRMDNLIRTEEWVWVAGDEFSMEGYRGAELQIVRDKKVYKVGDTARVLINSTAKGVYALLTIEGREIYMHRLLYLEKNSTLVELKALEEYVPNAYISVCLVNGTHFVSNEEPFNVSPKFKFLNVKVTSDKEVYKPGDTARYTIKTTDIDGKPRSAEVSLGVVDESIYAIVEDQTPDLREYYYGPKGNSVSTSYSFPNYYMGGTDKDGFKGKVRRNFPDTALWMPDIITDSNGTASVTMPVPDNLTTWRATARAVTEGTDVGSDVQKVRATKDLIVRLQTPRFLTQQDELQIGATLHNYTKQRQQVRLWLEVQGLSTRGSLTQTVSIDPDQIMRFSWPVRATRPGTATVTIKAQGDTDSDATEAEIPILAHGINRISTDNGSIDGDERTVHLDIPDTAIMDTVRMELRTTPTAAGIMLGSLKYLVSYEYGCMEQTTSRFAPNAVAADTMKMLGRKDPELERALPILVPEGLGRLYRFQRPDGGWGWWEDESDPYVTAYVIYGMTYARQAGFDVRQDSYDRAVNSLKSQLARFYAALQQKTPDEPPFADPNERIYMLYALSLTKQADARHLSDIFNDRRRLNSYGKAILALTLYEMGDRGRADTVATELGDESKSFKGMRHWEVKGADWGWEDSDIEATAYVLRALVRRDPKDPRLEEIVNWLTMKRSGERWRSTKDTAAVIYALAEYVRATPERNNPDYTAQVYLNGRLQKSFRVTRGDVFTRETVIPLNRNDLRIGRNDIRITKRGTGPMYFAAVARYFSLEENIRPSSSGIVVKREYFRLRPEQQANGTQELKPFAVGDTVNIADEILCRLTIQSNDNYHYVVVEDPRPAGWEPLEQLSDSGYYGYQGEPEPNGWAPWTRTEVKDQKVAIFATQLPRGKWKTEYRMRVEVPGTFHGLPTTAYGMYVPQVNGNSAENIMVDRQ